ncbi:hypothetical protein SLEP1_g13413 [Rubroshorea leprosula]|uniref:Uncharacterized protein n=1 Tax=Rubroshorea leprosula TaxID=152421 RepID=A0AAV5ILI9_9ROSI|nr:hypothetical protein SLEP1_g13413 [Rubroshorea leprosula]
MVFTPLLGEKVEEVVMAARMTTVGGRWLSSEEGRSIGEGWADVRKRTRKETCSCLGLATVVFENSEMDGAGGRRESYVARGGVEETMVFTPLLGEKVEEVVMAARMTTVGGRWLSSEEGRSIGEGWADVRKRTRKETCSSLGLATVVFENSEMDGAGGRRERWAKD